MFGRTRVGVLWMFLCAGLARVSAVDLHPTDVSVRCHNFENVVYWTSPDPQLQTEYIVTIKPYNGPFTFDLKTTKDFLDISNYTQDIRDVYFVSVKTLNGSEDNSSVIFTYKQDFPDSQGKKCTADFPRVDILPFTHNIEISFYHPLHIYSISGSSDGVFEYTVKCNETVCGEYKCMDEYEDEYEYENENENECTKDIPIPESLYGRCFSLHFIGYVDSTRFEGSKDVCVPVVPEKTDVRLITGVVCGAVFLLLLAIVAGVEIYKGVTGSDSQRAISKFMQSLGMMSSETPVIEPERPHMSKINSISDTPLLITPDNDISTPITFSPEEVTHMPITFITEVEEQGGSEEEEDFDNGGYDRKKFPLEMSPGDIVESYHHGKN